MIQYKDKILQESISHHRVHSADRIKLLGEVFTPTELVIEMLEKLPDETWDEGKTFLDNSCGNGQFLAAVAIIKRELGHKDYLSTIYGVDLMQDNVDECKERLLAIAGDTEENRAIVDRNIVCHDGLTYDYSFNGKVHESDDPSKEPQWKKGWAKTDEQHRTIESLKEAPGATGTIDNNPLFG